MKLGLNTMLAAAGATMLITGALADIPLPTTVTLFFQKNGKPYHKPVDFNVRCYGWANYPGQPGFPTGKRPDPYTPMEVYSYSGKCPDYGCAIHHALYLNYKHIDYCDLEGKSEGRPFEVKKFGSDPVGACQDPKRGSRFEQSCELRITLPE